MRWISTSLSMSFGGEDDGEEFDIRFSGIYYAGSPGIRHGIMAEPPSPPDFEVYSIEISYDDGEHWSAFPDALRTKRLEAQLSLIGMADEQGRAQRDREALQDLRDEAADAARRDRMLDRAFGRLEAQWTAPSVAAE